MGELHPQGGFSFRTLIGWYGFEAVPERRPKEFCCRSNDTDTLCYSQYAPSMPMVPRCHTLEIPWMLYKMNIFHEKSVAAKAHSLQNHNRF